MQFLLASALLVLLLGCANLANLFLVRARRRDLEIGIRTALGASSARLVRPVVLEAAFIGLAGAALAVVVTRLSFDALVQQVPPIAYRGVRVGLDLRVAFFALLLGLSSGILFSAAAVWRTSRQDAIAVMQGGARRGRSFSRRFGWPLVVAQAALALALVFGASVAAQALVSIVRTPLAFDAENVAAVRVLPAADGVEREAVYQALADRLAAHPDVIAVGAAASLPLDGATVFDSIRGADGSPVLGIDHVLPGYFESIGAQLRAGRLFTVDDLRGDRAVAVISEAFARARFPGRDPIGATFQGADTSTQYRVIGVIADLRTAPDPSEMPVAYVFPGADTRGMVLAVRLARRSDAVLGDLRRLAGTLVPEAPVTARWWSDSLRQLTAYRNPRFQTLVLGGFALLALILTATGVASVVGALLAGRAREMGVRLAVGATPASLMILLLRYALTPVVAGTLAGIVITRALTQLAEAQLYRVNTDDPRTLVVASVVVIATALAAAFVPARRARRIDPVTMLRSE